MVWSPRPRAVSFHAAPVIELDNWRSVGELAERIVQFVPCLVGEGHGDDLTGGSRYSHTRS